jgi:hypothetical protein
MTHRRSTRRDMQLPTLARRLGTVALVAGLGLGAAACSGDASDSDDSTITAEESPDATRPPEH